MKVGDTVKLINIEGSSVSENMLGKTFFVYKMLTGINAFFNFGNVTVMHKGEPVGLNEGRFVSCRKLLIEKV